MTKARGEVGHDKERKRREGEGKGRKRGEGRRRVGKGRILSSSAF